MTPACRSTAVFADGSVCRPRDGHDPPTGVQLLILLWRNGATSHSDLRRTLGIDGASVARLVKEFEAEGLVGRRLDPADNLRAAARRMYDAFNAHDHAAAAEIFTADFYSHRSENLSDPRS
ncbi:MarR family winged helix-turn-helix transcriptional regulator [Nonomuraea sp. NPDC050786]|uniref:MarR family winged helix-turn-helix transcriptional regulator n=1 Tax=Nonomuraea sp. NPDC050786 TaxID=3154840 RepID=UPI00340CFBE4